MPTSSTERIDVLNPFTEQIAGTVPVSTPADVDFSVRAARDAFPGWAATSVSARIAAVERIATGLRERRGELAQVITAELGSPLRESDQTQVGLALGDLSGMCAVAADYDFEEDLGSSRVVREAAGVAACITPWNYPLHQIALKVGAALIAGCTVVLKPSELTPLNAFVLTDVIADSGLPDGVFNLVSGSGLTVGEPLVAHPEVDLVSFTGSSRAGTRIAQLSAPRAGRVSLELGGKSAAIVLEDADLDEAIPAVVAKCMENSGQSCSAHTRLLVPRQHEQQALERAVESARRLVTGDPNPATDLGPLVSAEQRERVREHVDTALAQGADRLLGDAGAASGNPTGYFVEPTIFRGVEPEMRLFREEVFGPVLAISTFTDQDHAVALANDSDYGLSGGVWSGDRDRAVGVARQLRTGQVAINGGGYDFRAPFGGYKRSGVGRESGRFGLEEFLEVKALLG